MFDLKFPPILKMTIYSMPQEPISIWQHWIHLAAAVHRCNEHEFRGFTSLLTMCLSRPAITNPEQCRVYVASLQVYGASELELKVICVIGNSTIFLLVASFVMEKNK